MPGFISGSKPASLRLRGHGRRVALATHGSIIPIIAKAQEDDGYIATQVTAGKFRERWISPNNHELYNMGHLLAAAAVHYRITGKTELVDVAKQAALSCLRQFREHPDVMWEYPLNPSIIMGAVELYRATGHRDALDLARHIVDLRGFDVSGHGENAQLGPARMGYRGKAIGADRIFIRTSSPCGTKRKLSDTRSFSLTFTPARPTSIWKRATAPVRRLGAVVGRPDRKGRCTSPAA